VGVKDVTRFLPAGSGQRARDDTQHEIGLTQRRQVVHPRRYGQLTSGDAGGGAPVSLDQRGIAGVTTYAGRSNRSTTGKNADPRGRRQQHEDIIVLIFGKEQFLAMEPGESAVPRIGDALPLSHPVIGQSRVIGALGLGKPPQGLVAAAMKNGTAANSRSA
jgi:hypothetical protein